MLPLSHDEVVHGKKSILDRMPGDAWQKFANLRAYYGWMFAFPGKKLLFMGNEFAQGREWNHDTSLDWHLLEGADNWHHGVQRLVRDLNLTYRHHKALHELDFDPYGFEWLVVDDHERSVFVLRQIPSAHGRPPPATQNRTDRSPARAVLYGGGRSGSDRGPAAARRGASCQRPPADASRGWYRGSTRAPGRTRCP